MNAPVPSKALLDRTDDCESETPLAAEPVLRWTWKSRFGAILIEVVGDDVFVDGKLVQPYCE
jgi:hypothetical protein